MKAVSRNALLRQLALQGNGKEDVGGLALAIGDDAQVTLVGLQIHLGEALAPALLLGDVGALFEVVVAEANGADGVGAAGEVDDPRLAGAGPVLAGGGLEQGQQEVGEQKGTNVVGAELALDALGGGEALHDGEAGVVDEQIELGGEAGDLGGGGAHRGLGGEVEGHGPDVEVRVGGLQVGYDGGEVGGGAGGEEKEGRGLGGEGGGGSGADAVGADTGDEDCLVGGERLVEATLDKTPLVVWIWCG